MCEKEFRVLEPRFLTRWEDRKDLVHVVFVAGSKTKQSLRREHIVACQNFGLEINLNQPLRLPHGIGFSSSR
jgi:hypothetical protein